MKELKHITIFKNKKGDLIIFDRGYPAYELFTSIIHSDQSDFLMRIRKIALKIPLIFLTQLVKMMIS